MDVHDYSVSTTELDFDREGYLAVLEQDWYLENHPEQMGHLFFDEEDHRHFCENARNTRTNFDPSCLTNVVWKKEGF